MINNVSQHPIQSLYRQDTNSSEGFKKAGDYGSGLTGDVSLSNNGAIKLDLSEKALKKLGIKSCETCEQRTYQDESNDPGVSFKTPTRLSPERAAYAVAGHEQEHVLNAQADARVEEKEIVYQSVRIYTDTCPECGRVYVSGGETRTMMKEKPKQKEEAGRILDIFV